MKAPMRTSAKSPDEIARAYRSPPWWYDLRGFFILTFAYRSTLGRMVQFFANNMGAEHLELACGTGTLLEFQMKWRRRHRMPNVKLTGVDYAESMLAGAIRRFRKLSKWRFVHGDVAHLPFNSALFDSVSIANSIHCFSDVKMALDETYRVLKPGGSFAANILLFPSGNWIEKLIAERINLWGIRKGILVSPFEQATIRAHLLDAHFEIISEKISGNCYYVCARKPT